MGSILGKLSTIIDGKEKIRRTTSPTTLIVVPISGRGLREWGPQTLTI